MNKRVGNLCSWTCGWQALQHGCSVLVQARLRLTPSTFNEQKVIAMGNACSIFGERVRIFRARQLILEQTIILRRIDLRNIVQNFDE